MFKKILFATTASPTCDNAAKVAFDLEMKWDAKLYVFHVLGIPSRGYSPFVTDVRTGELTEPDSDYIDWVKEEMKNTYDVLLKDSENAVIDAAVGVPYREILRAHGIGEERKIAPFFPLISYERNSGVPHPRLSYLSGCQILGARQQ